VPGVKKKNRKAAALADSALKQCWQSTRHREEYQRPPSALFRKRKTAAGIIFDIGAFISYDNLGIAVTPTGVAGLCSVAIIIANEGW
jgi:hypothetical protein